MREAAHERFEAPVEQLVLIFGGRILKDPDHLQKEGKKHVDVFFLWDLRPRTLKENGSWLGPKI